MKRTWILLGALLVTLAALSLAMLLGSASFDFRRYTQHEGRLRNVMREAPTAERLTQGFADEGTVLLATGHTAEERQAIAARGGRRLAETRAKASRYAQLRLFATEDMLYFIYFDADGVMRDFTTVSR